MRKRKLVRWQAGIVLLLTRRGVQQRLEHHRPEARRTEGVRRGP